MKVYLSFDDGNFLDWTVAQMLKERGHKATFYFSKNNPKHDVMTEHEIKEFHKEFPYMEIGQHTLMHNLLTQLTWEKSVQDIDQGFLWHGKLFDEEYPKSFCFPRGYYTKEMCEYLSAIGYENARVVKSKNLGIPKYEIEAGFHIYKQINDDDGEGTDEYLVDKVEELLEQGKDFGIWGHSWEIEKYDLWGDLEEILNVIPKGITVSEYAEGLK